VEFAGIASWSCWNSWCKSRRLSIHMKLFRLWPGSLHLPHNLSLGSVASNAEGSLLVLVVCVITRKGSRIKSEGSE
jgi:hypothetical protein